MICEHTYLTKQLGYVGAIDGRPSLIIHSPVSDMHRRGGGNATICEVLAPDKFDSIHAMMPGSMRKVEEVSAISWSKYHQLWKVVSTRTVNSQVKRKERIISSVRYYDDYPVTKSYVTGVSSDIVKERWLNVDRWTDNLFSPTMDHHSTTNWLTFNNMLLDHYDYQAEDVDGVVFLDTPYGPQTFNIAKRKSIKWPEHGAKPHCMYFAYCGIFMAVFGKILPTADNAIHDAKFLFASNPNELITNVIVECHK